MCTMALPETHRAAPVVSGYHTMNTLREKELQCHNQVMWRLLQVAVQSLKSHQEIMNILSSIISQP